VQYQLQFDLKPEAFIFRVARN